MNHFYRLRLRETATKSFIPWLNRQLNVEIPKTSKHLLEEKIIKREKIAKIVGNQRIPDATNRNYN
jgi:hypothetical protein